MRAINIGCGKDYRTGWLNTDCSVEARADIVHDIRYEKLPVDDGSTDLVYASGVLEQILANEDLRFAINEVWRVLRSGGRFEIVVPNAEHSIAFQDPFDVRKFVPKTFDYLVGSAREYLLYGSVYGFKPWKSATITENQRHILEVTLVK
jgi:predicted SAM-dependent methyltransferase